MSVRNRIFLVFVAAAGIAIAGLIHWMQDDLRPRYLEAQEEPLVDFAHVLAALVETRALQPYAGTVRIDPQLLAGAFAALRNHDVDAQIYGLHKSDVDLRVYVTDADGQVVFDSDNDRDLGANYARWHDVRRTLDGAYGARMTEGDPIYPQGDTMYIAAPIRSDGHIVGVVSIGKPTRNAERFLGSAIPRFTRAAITALAGALLIALVIYAWVSRPLERVHEYARVLRTGARVAPPDLGNNEIGRVAEAMAELRNALDGKDYVERYVQSLAHELKSPTAAIRGAAELLAEDMPPADRARFLDNIRRESHRLQELIERMLELSAIENRDGLDTRDEVALAPLIEQVVESLRPLSAQAQAHIETRCDAALRVAGDPFLLQRALANLLKNAIEVSPENGHILLTARADAGEIVIALRDHGPGIPEYARDRLFERFYSLPQDSRGAGARKGSGLGLAFVKEIAELHGGWVRIGNADGGGALAELGLPA